MATRTSWADVYDTYVTARLLPSLLFENLFQKPGNYRLMEQGYWYRHLLGRAFFGFLLHTGRIRPGGKKVADSGAG